MTTEYTTFRAAVYLFLWYDSSFLLLRREGTEYKQGFWGLPSGHVEQAESISSAMQREALEEIGIGLPTSLEPRYCLQRILSNGLCYFDFFFVYEIQESGLVINAEPSKCSSPAWFNTFPTKSVEYLPLVLDDIRAGITFGTHYETNV